MISVCIAGVVAVDVAVATSCCSAVHTDNEWFQRTFEMFRKLGADGDGGDDGGGGGWFYWKYWYEKRNQ